ncbi:MAG: lysozyme family protein [Acidimicrobiales bacterium]
MNILPQHLGSQYERATKEWPFMHKVEEDFGLPHMFLLAIGSRETNLSNIVGDKGFGHGVFQLDSRYHKIPDGFDGDVRVQAERAASMLRDLLQSNAGIPQRAANCYNAGPSNPTDRGTTGNDYGSDVVGRMTWLQHQFPEDRDEFAPDEVVDVLSSPKGGFWLLQANGDVRTSGDADHHGSYPVLPAALRQGSRTFASITPNARGGYTLWSRAGEPYDFPV